MKPRKLNETIDESGNRPLLQVRNTRKYFYNYGRIGIGRSVVQAIDDISFDVASGITLGVVGESGCGKSTMGRVLMRLIEPEAGEIIFDGYDYTQASGNTLRELRQKIQLVFQDSYSSLNPRLTAEDTIAFGPRGHGASATKAVETAHELLAKVGLAPERFAHRYPHELSGGQRQRVNIARALAMNPQLIILDEAVSALDKSVVAQVLNLLIDLKKDLGATYIFISHDLNVVRYISDRILVMYLGKIVELGKADAIYQTPQHPYTRALLAATPSMDPDNRITVAPLTGDPPNPINPPSGCRFHPRCAFAAGMCSQIEPQLIPASGADQLSACHMSDPSSGHPNAYAN